MNAHQRRIDRRAIARGEQAPRPQRTRIRVGPSAGAPGRYSLEQLRWEREVLRQRLRRLQQG